MRGEVKGGDGIGIGVSLNEVLEARWGGDDNN